MDIFGKLVELSLLDVHSPDDEVILKLGERVIAIDPLKLILNHQVNTIWTLLSTCCYLSFILYLIIYYKYNITYTIPSQIIHTVINIHPLPHIVYIHHTPSSYDIKSYSLRYNKINSHHPFKCKCIKQYQQKHYIQPLIIITQQTYMKLR